MANNGRRPGGKNGKGMRSAGGRANGRGSSSYARRDGGRGERGRATYRGSRGGRAQDSDRRGGYRSAGRRPGAGGQERRGGGSRVTASYIEGRRACAEALEAGVPLKKALVMRGEMDETLQRLVARLNEEDVEIEQVPKAVLDQLSSHGAHQGIVVQAAPFEYADLEDIVHRAGEGPALVVVLDHVTDEGNFGAIVRSAEVVGAAGVVIAKARAASVGTAAYKTSAGAVMHVPIAQVPNLGAALDRLKEVGFWAGAATEHAHDDVWHAPMGGRLCLVMGSEDKGISRLVREKCDFECRLPQRGRIESLNVAQAATVLCYEWLRRVTEESLTSGATYVGETDD